MEWVSKKSLEIKCEFDLSKFPNDQQDCFIIPFIRIYDESEVFMSPFQDDLGLIKESTSPVTASSSEPT